MSLVDLDGGGVSLLIVGTAVSSVEWNDGVVLLVVGGVGWLLVAVDDGGLSVVFVISVGGSSIILEGGSLLLIVGRASSKS